MGLNFCPRPLFTTSCLKWTKKGFFRDLYLKMFFAHGPSDFDQNKLYTKSSFIPPASKIPQELTNRLQQFFARFATRFRRCRLMPNLLLHKRHQLNVLKNDNGLIVIKTDKNLGPAVIKCCIYVQRALKDHLYHHQTYRRTAEREANGCTIAIK